LLALFAPVCRADIYREPILASDRKKIFPIGAASAQIQLHLLETRTFHPRKIGGKENAGSRRIEPDRHRSIRQRSPVRVGDEQRHGRGIGVGTKPFDIRCGFEVDAELVGPCRYNEQKERRE
jgi:hypothetical protein